MVLQQHGISSVPFRGGFKRGKKDWMKEIFQNRAQVLVRKLAEKALTYSL